MTIYIPPRPQLRVTLPHCPMSHPALGPCARGHGPRGDLKLTNCEQCVAIWGMTLGRRVLSPLNGTKYWLTHDQRQARCFLRLSLCPREFLLCYFVDMPCIVIWSTQTRASPSGESRCHQYNIMQQYYLCLDCFKQRFMTGHVCIACYLYISALWSKL